MNRRLRRVAGSILAAGIVLTGLSACYVGPAGPACDPQVTSGTSSDAVRVQGEVFSTPTITFPTPLRPSTTEATTVVQGDGEAVRSDQYVGAYLSFLNGSTGELLDQSDYTASGAASFVIDRLPIEGLREGLQCASVGDRIAVVIPADEAFAAESRPAELSDEDPVVVVVDLRSAYLSRAQGTAQVAEPGMPSVVLAPSGQPGITVPDAEAPAELRIARLIEGDGRTLKDGETALVNYTGVLWASGDVFDSSWENGSPLPISLQEGQAIPGFLDALRGQKVGSQVLAVIPPEDAYGDAGSGSVPPGATLVFVIDILGVLE